MEQPQFTWSQESLLFKEGLNYHNWLFVSEDEEYLTIKYKFTGHIKKLRKG